MPYNLLLLATFYEEKTFTVQYNWIASQFTYFKQLSTYI